MTKDAVISRFFKIAHFVNRNVYKYSAASDCLHSIANNKELYEFDEKILTFIENAVNEKIVNDKNRKGV